MCRSPRSLGNDLAAAPLPTQGHSRAVQSSVPSHTPKVFLSQHLTLFPRKLRSSSSCLSERPFSRVRGQAWCGCLGSSGGSLAAGATAVRGRLSPRRAQVCSSSYPVPPQPAAAGPRPQSLSCRLVPSPPASPAWPLLSASGSCPSVSETRWLAALPGSTHHAGGEGRVISRSPSRRHRQTWGET